MAAISDSSSGLPAVQVPGATVIDPADRSPTTWKQIAAGETDTGLDKVNANAVRGDLTGRWGGGGYAVVTGLDLSSGGGLSLSVSAGQAMIDGPVTKKAAVTLALSDNIDRVYIWLSQTGDLTPVNNSATPPAGAQCYLGSCKTASGAISNIDTSGRMELRGGYLMRETGDLGPPADTPPASIRFLNKTLTGLYYWTGSAWLPITNALSVGIPDVIPAGTTIHVPANHQMPVHRKLRIDGKILIDGKVVITE